jgi:hypothetical protein
MKSLIIILVFITLAKVAPAQQDLLSFDEHNKYIYYQVVDMPGFPADTLRIRGLSFIKKVFPKIKMKSAPADNNLNGEGKFPIYSGVIVMKHQGGEITYSMNIEIKDEKYRYWLTGFVFTPYKRDRYDNFVPEPGLETPLESALSKYEKKDVASYLSQTGAFCKEFGDKLKLYMVNAPKKDESIKKIVTDKW